MKNTQAISLTSKYQIAETVIILGATMLLPLLVHLLPAIGENPSGAVLLPVFIAPMAATFFYKKQVAIFAGIFAPLFNYLLLGSPAPQMVVMLSIEIVAFVLILGWLKNKASVRYVAAPLAYLGAVVATLFALAVSGVISNPVSFGLNAVVTAVPGIILLAIGNLVLLKFRK